MQSSSSPRDRIPVLIAGGNGYIGRALALELRKKDYLPIVLNRSADGAEDFKEWKIPFYQGDMNDKEVLKTIYDSYPFDTVAIMAASKVLPKDKSFDENNVDAPLALARNAMALGVQGIVFASSMLVYQPKYEALKLTDGLSSVQEGYIGSKVKAERGFQLLFQDALKKDVHVKIELARISNVAGSYVGCREHSGVVPSWVKSLLAGQAISVVQKTVGDKSIYPVKDYISPEDVAAGLALIITHIRQAKEGYIQARNLGSGKETSLLEIIEILRQELGSGVAVKPLEGDVNSMVLDITETIQELGWTPKSDITAIVETEIAYQQSLLAKQRATLATASQSPTAEPLQEKPAASLGTADIKGVNKLVSAQDVPKAPGLEGFFPLEGRRQLDQPVSVTLAPVIPGQTQ